MARSAREVLLEEARDRHKMELARYAEAHTRVGVHLAVLAVFALALLRYVDKFPSGHHSAGFWVFVVSSVVLCVVTLVVFGLVLGVIWGFGTRFPAPMETWRNHAKELSRSVSSDEAQVAEALEQDLMENMCEAADENARKNDLRSRLIVYASRGLVGAAVAFVTSGVAYLALSLGVEAPTPVVIGAPVQVQLQGSVQLNPIQMQGPMQVQPIQMQGPVELRPVEIHGTVKIENPTRGTPRGQEPP